MPDAELAPALAPETAELVADPTADRVAGGTRDAGVAGDRVAAVGAHHPQLAIQFVPTNRRVDLAKGEADIAIRNVWPTEGDVIARRGLNSEWRSMRRRLTSRSMARRKPTKTSVLTV